MDGLGGGWDLPARNWRLHASRDRQNGSGSGSGSGSGVGGGAWTHASPLPSPVANLLMAKEGMAEPPKVVGQELANEPVTGSLAPPPPPENGKEDAPKLSPPPKRTRLGWGQGLAKYEKKKDVEPDESGGGVPVSSNTEGGDPRGVCATSPPHSSPSSPMSRGGPSVASSGGASALLTSKVSSLPALPSENFEAPPTTDALPPPPPFPLFYRDASVNSLADLQPAHSLRGLPTAVQGVREVDREAGGGREDGAGVSVEEWRNGGASSREECEGPEGRAPLLAARDAPSESAHSQLPVMKPVKLSGFSTSESGKAPTSSSEALKIPGAGNSGPWGSPSAKPRRNLSTAERPLPFGSSSLPPGGQGRDVQMSDADVLSPSSKGHASQAGRRGGNVSPCQPPPHHKPDYPSPGRGKSRLGEWGYVPLQGAPTAAIFEDSIAR